MRITNQDSEPEAQNVPDDYDWRTDTEPTHSHGGSHIKDPWTAFQEPEDPEAAPSVVWFHIVDPYERAEAYRAQLIKQYGDRAAIDVLAELKPKIWQHIPLTLDEMIRHAEAQMEIWPTEGTRSSIELFKEWKAEGREVSFQYDAGSRARSTDEFLDVKPFVEQYGWAKGIAKFRQINPARAAEFERTVRQSLDPEGAAAFERAINQHPHSH